MILKIQTLSMSEYTEESCEADISSSSSPRSDMICKVMDLVRDSSRIVDG